MASTPQSAAYRSRQGRVVDAEIIRGSTDRPDNWETQGTVLAGSDDNMKARLVEYAQGGLKMADVHGFLLHEILTELKVQNAHLALLTEASLTADDI